MRNRYDSKMNVGLVFSWGLGTQCPATTGQVCDHDIHYVTYMITKGAIRKGWQYFHMPPPRSNISEHGVGDGYRDGMPVESRVREKYVRNGAARKVQR